MIFKTVVTTMIALVCLLIMLALRKINGNDRTIAGLFLVVYFMAALAIWL